VNPIVGFLIVIVVLQLVALLAAVVARYWVLKTASFELHGIDVPRATELVAAYLQGVHDHRFGFPTGIFEIDGAQTAPGRVVAREVNLKGSAGFGPIVFGLKLPFLGLAGGLSVAEADGGCLVAAIGASMGFAIGCFLAAVIIVPCAFVTVVELVLRTLMRAEIRAEIDPVADQSDSVRVWFELRGLSAFGIEEQLRRGMRPPHPRTAPGPPPDPVTTGAPASQFDRLNAIYASAASVALICSVVAIVLVGHAASHPSSANASYAYEESGYEEPYETYEEEPYGEEGYEEEGYEEPYEEQETYGEAEYGSEAEGESVESAPETPFEAAKAAFRSYWTDIDDGEYGAAYEVYYRSYATQEGVSKGEFVESENEYFPNVGLDAMTLTESERNPTSPNELWIYAEVPIEDGTGEFAGECRLFYGDVRMFHAEGQWWYRPGTAFGRKPSFGQEGGGIRVLPPDSARCS
jgi:hypothetical protein